jgi:hypothetical protein
MADEQQEDQPFVSRIGPIDIDWPRSLGFFGGIALAIAFDLIAPEIALFVACVPLVKLLERQHATRPEKAIAAIMEGAAKPLGGDAEATIRPALGLRPAPSAMDQITPVSSALSTARVRSRTPSLARMLDTWFLTVPSAVASTSAISRLL